MWKPVSSALKAAVALAASACAPGAMATDMPGAASDRPLPTIAHPSDRAEILAAVGRLTAGGAPVCTATLVMPRTIATAAHCVWNDAAKTWRRPEDLAFQAQYHRGGMAGAANVVAIARDPAVKGPEDFRNGRADWALLTLDTDLARRIQPIPLEPLDADSLKRNGLRGTLVFAAGYDRKDPDEFATQSGCIFRELSEDGKLLLHDCARIAGGGGEALLYRIEGRYSLAGVNARLVEYQGRTFGFGVPGKTFLDRLAAGASARAGAAKPAPEQTPEPVITLPAGPAAGRR